MWSFLKKLHLSVFALSFLGLIVLLITLLVSTIGSTNIKPKSVLLLKMNQEIVEHTVSNPLLSDFEIPFSTYSPKIGVINLVQGIHEAKTDDDIAVLFLDLSIIRGGLASVKEIRDALEDFKTSGKKVIAYGDYIDEKSYYLGSVADEFYVAPEGMIEFNGFVAEVRFYKNVLESIGVKPKVFRVGRFKSAVEPFLRDSISKENNHQISEFLGSLHESLLEGVSASRGVSVDKLKEISNNMLVRNPYQAKEQNLIDDVIYYDQVLDRIRDLGSIPEADEVNFVDANAYWETPLDLGNGDQVAVIVADGDINMGENKDGSIGGNGMAKLIRQVRLDPKVKAVVLRINSPGGSALASDLMWREIELTKQSKPIIASMSDMAASGGYYMAMACDTIVAHENTITGSIGVFGLLFNIEELLNDKIGIHTDRVKTGKFSDLATPTRKMTQEDSLIIQTEVNNIYKSFVSKAAEGRGMAYDDLEAVASGRVWSGSMAKENGLVDVFGGIDTAVAISANKAGVDDYSIVYYPRLSPISGEVMAGYKNTKLSSLIKGTENKELIKYISEIEKIGEMKGVQARSPFLLEIK